MSRMSLMGVCANTKVLVLHEYGSVLNQSDKLDEAERILRSALALSDSPSVRYLNRLNVIQELASVLNSLNRHEESESLMRSAIALAKSRNAHPQVVCNLYHEMAESKMGMKQWSNARKCLQSALDLVDKWNLGASTRCAILMELGTVWSEQERWNDGLLCLKDATSDLLDSVGTHTTLGGIPHLMKEYSRIFAVGRRLAERSWKETNDPKALSYLTAFWDIERCISIREGLRRIATRSSSPAQQPRLVAWKASNRNWRRALRSAYKRSTEQSKPMRRLEMTEPKKSPSIQQISKITIASVGQTVPDFADPFNLDDLNRVLTETTVVLGIYRDGDDLVFVPYRKDTKNGMPTLLYDRDGLFRARGVSADLGILLDLQSEYLADIDQQKLYRERPDIMNKHFPLGPGLYSKLHSVLRLDDLLKLICTDDLAASKVDLIVIPDQWLYSLPLHAAYDMVNKKPLIEKVRSISYALSLRTIANQHEIDKADTRSASEIKGTIFACPGPKKNYLMHVTDEVDGLVNEDGIKHWSVFGVDPPFVANRQSMRMHHGIGSLLWTIGHGGPTRQSTRNASGLEAPRRQASIGLVDGPLTEGQMLEQQFDFHAVRHLHYSCCFVGEISQKGETRELEGLIASLSLMRARRVTSAIWALHDEAAAKCGPLLFHELRTNAFRDDRQPHAFSRAFKAAISKFRAIDKGRWDHEFFWAPYVFYGLP